MDRVHKVIVNVNMCDGNMFLDFTIRLYSKKYFLRVFHFRVLLFEFY